MTQSRMQGKIYDGALLVGVGSCREKTLGTVKDLMVNTRLSKRVFRARRSRVCKKKTR